jgi:hypothetical protein
LAATAVTRAFLALTDAGGTTTLYWLGVASTQVTGFLDISGGVAVNAPVVGQCVRVNVTVDHSLIDLDIR